MGDGAVIRMRRHGNPSGPRLLCCHGNGFATDAYWPFWRHLLDRYDILLYDQRNHGWNPRHLAEGHTVGGFVDDMDRLLDQTADAFGPKPTIGAFHSISGITSIRHAQERGWRWDALILFDPPLVPSQGHELHAVARDFELGLSEWALKRPDKFDSPDDLAARFERSKSLAGWTAGSHALMARSILRQVDGTDQWELCCPREWESGIYAENAVLDLTPRLDALSGAVKFVCSDPLVEDPRAPALVNRAMHEKFGHPYEGIPGTTHMLQLEEPEACADIVTRFLADQGLG